MKTVRTFPTLLILAVFVFSLSHIAFAEHEQQSSKCVAHTH